MSIVLQELNHVALVTRNVEASERFYCDLLGFQRLPRPNFNFRGAWLRGGGLTIHLIDNATGGPGLADDISSRHNHLAFAVANLADVRNLLTERGVSFKEQVNAGGAQQIFLRDPDGHHLELAVYPTPTA